MNTFDGFEIREIPLTVELFRRRRADFLRENGLRDEDADYCAGIFDCEDNLIGTGALHGNVIKNLALSESARSASLSNSLVTHLLAKAAETGYPNVMVFTKPEYRRTFENLSFRYVGGCEDAVLLESDPRGVSSYSESLVALRREVMERCSRRQPFFGVIVMNANPMTIGHLYLIETAARKTDHLFVIPVADNEKTQFGYDARCEMLRRATADISNVTVCEGSSYTISSSTFPSYFLKSISDATDTHIRLDLDVFLHHIAPALGVSVRFVGSEPDDPLTARYNELMKEILPAAGLDVVEIERCRIGGDYVSASAVRRSLAEGRMAEAMAMLPLSSVPVMAPEIALRALVEELDTTPKPGLVDRNDSGAHDDMDYHLMRRSITSLVDFFREVCAEGERGCDCRSLHDAGIRAEKKMMEATGGVNTHKGALFSLGLLAAAVCKVSAQGGRLTASAVSDEVVRIASGFSQPEGTHGDIAGRKYGRGGALGNARDGYRQLFKSWLPFLKSMLHSCGMEWQQFNNYRKQRLLLKIMSELDDSNILYRCGAETADSVRAMARRLLDIEDPAELNAALEDVNRLFISRRISPGGAADMVALTLFAEAFVIG